MLRTISVVILCVFIVFKACADLAADRVQHKLNYIKTMQANFSQKTYAKHRRAIYSTGHMALSRPGRMLWSIEKPEKQMLVADGKRLWIYDVALEQVTVKPERQGVGGVAGLFLASGHTSVEQHFKV